MQQDVYKSLVVKQLHNKTWYSHLSGQPEGTLTQPNVNSWAN
jgi:hypothetical protein